MSPPEVAVKHQHQRAAQATATARSVGELWRHVDSDDIRGSWQALLPRAIALVAAGQLGAAKQAEPYLKDLLPGVDRAGRVRPESLVGVSADGRALAELLLYPLWVALNRITRGMTTTASLASGGAFLDLVARTVVADIGRASDLVGMIARPAVTSYVRVVELPACARCILLAGREYTLSTGFQRHPRCDCTMQGVTRASRPEPTSPESVFGQMSATQRAKVFGAAAVKAVDAGADIAQVINARRGMNTATAYGRTVQATTEGMTRRGIAGKRRHQARAPRLMPEEILRIASSREQAIRLLEQHAYITNY